MKFVVHIWCFLVEFFFNFLYDATSLKKDEIWVGKCLTPLPPDEIISSLAASINFEMILHCSTISQNAVREESNV
jgi:hypothetical protein